MPSPPTTAADLAADPAAEATATSSEGLGVDAVTEISAILRDGFSELKSQVAQVGLRKTKDVQYTTLEDFRRADPALQRMLIIGCTGAGKSTLLNLMGGWRFVQKPPDFEFEWLPKMLPVEEADADADADAVANAAAAAPSAAQEAAAEADAEEEAEGIPPLFESGAGSDSVTKRTSYANLEWFGDSSRSFIAVDTPGHDDPSGADIDSPTARDALGSLAADLHNKLKALGHVNAILVLHNDVVSNRLNPATYTILKMVDEKFSKAGTSVWNHVLVGYSKCNAHDVTWRAGLSAKCKALQQAIREKVPSCNVDVPVIALGGASIEPPPPSHIPAPETGGFEALWDFLAAAPPLDCTNLQPFEGVDVKWQQLVTEKDEAEARAKAAVIYVAVLMKLASLFLFLFVRACCLPRSLAALIACGLIALSVYLVQSSEDRSKVPRAPMYAAAMAALMVNFYTVIDELALLVLFISYVGPNDLKNSIKHFNSVWIEPRLHLSQYFKQVEEVSVALLRGATSAMDKTAAAKGAAKQKAA